MKKSIIILTLISAATLTACGGAKQTAFEFKESAKAECANDLTGGEGIIKRDECMVQFYMSNMKKNVQRGQLSQADNDLNIVQQQLQKNLRTLNRR